MNTKFLPIGTVVSLKGANKKLMITGFCMYNKENNNQMYDYCGCLFPEGIINTEKISLFNHEQIERIYYLGLQNDEEIIFKKQLTSAFENRNSNNTNQTPTQQSTQQ